MACNITKNEFFHKYFPELLTKNSKHLCSSQWLRPNTDYKHFEKKLHLQLEQYFLFFLLLRKALTWDVSKTFINHFDN